MAYSTFFRKILKLFISCQTLLKIEKDDYRGSFLKEAGHYFIMGLRNNYV